MEAALITDRNSSGFCSENVKTWFDEFVGGIRADQLKLETGVASKEEQQLYKTMIMGDSDFMMSSIRATTVQYFIGQIITEFLSELKDVLPQVVNIAFSYNASSVLCWAVIPDDNEALEDALIMAKAGVDAKFLDKGFGMSLTILEKSDEVSIPTHYQSIQ